MKNNRRSRKTTKVRAIKILLKMRSVNKHLTPAVRRAIWSAMNSGEHIRLGYELSDFGLTVLLTVKNGNSLMQPKLKEKTS